MDIGFETIGNATIICHDERPVLWLVQVECALLRPFARCCYVGLGAAPAEIHFDEDVIFKVLTIYGSWTFSKAELIEIARFFVETKVGSVVFKSSI